MARRSRFLEDLIGGVGLGANLADMYMERQAGDAYKDASVQQSRAGGTNLEGIDDVGQLGYAPDANPEVQYGLGGKWRNTEFSPTERRSAGLQAMGDYWSGRGNIKRASDLYDQVDQMGLRDDQRAASALQRQLTQHNIDRLPQADKVQDLAVQDAERKKRNADLEDNLHKAILGGRQSLIDFYANHMPDGFKAVEKPMKGGGFQLVQVDDGGVERGVIGTFKDDTDLQIQAMKKAPTLLSKAMELQDKAAQRALESRKIDEQAKHNKDWAQIFGNRYGAGGGTGGKLKDMTVPVFDADSGRSGKAPLTRKGDSYYLAGRQLTEDELDELRTTGGLTTGVGKESPYFSQYQSLVAKAQGAKSVEDTQGFEAMADRARKAHQTWVQNRKMDPEAAANELVRSLSRGVTAEEVLADGYSPAVLDYFETDRKGRLVRPKMGRSASSDRGPSHGIKLRETGLVPDAIKYWGNAGQNAQVDYLRGKISRGEKLAPNEQVRAERLGLY